MDSFEIIKQLLWALPGLLFTVFIIGCCIYFLAQKISAGVILVLIGSVLSMAGKFISHYINYQVMSHGMMTELEIVMTGNRILHMISYIVSSIGLIMVLFGYLKASKQAGTGAVNP